MADTRFLDEQPIHNWHATKHRGRYHDDVMMVLPLMLESEAAAICAPTEDVTA